MAPPSPEAPDSEPDAPDEDARDDEARDDDDAGHAPPPRRRRLLPVILVLGAVVAGGPLLTGTQDRRELTVRLEAPDRVTGISLVLRDGHDALWGTERTFAAGAAPPHLSRTLPLPPGRYELVVQLTEEGRSRRIERYFDVTEDASEVVVPVR